MPSTSKKLTKKAQASRKAAPSAAAAAAPKSKPLPDEEDSDSEDDDDLDLEGSEDDDDSAIEFDGEDDEDEEEEEDDVTEEGMKRMMELLGDVDPEELGIEVEGEEDEEEDDEDVEEDGMSVDGDDDDEVEFEELSEEDGDTVPVERTTVNDKTALERVLATFKQPTTFFDTLTLTNPKALNIPDAEDDLSRELEFYKQALWAAQHAEQLYSQADLPFTRPDDYFAEMVKTDHHMSLIRQSLLDESAGIKASEDARKLREAKKFGKKVQVARIQEREKEKRDVGKRLDQLKKRRKGADGGFGTTEEFDVALEEAIAGPSKKKKVVESERGRGGKARGGISRRGRDAKYGNPTATRRPKENNDKLDGDGFGRSGRGGRGRGGARGGRGRGGAARGGAKRLGKSRRN